MDSAAPLLPGYYRDDPGFRDVPSPHANHLDYRDTGIVIATLVLLSSKFGAAKTATLSERVLWSEMKTAETCGFQIGL